ncbi:MAG: hypothetical protein AB7G28_23605 [Pirellulales bacterium]
MKANLRGLGGIKHFFVMHGEKLGVVLVALGALYLMYGAMGRESLPPEKAATKLNEQITLARGSMQGFTWPKYKEAAPENVRTVVPLAKTDKHEVDPDAYRTKTANIPWDAYVVPPVVLRTDPVLLEAQDLETHGGSGLLAFVDPAVRRAKMREQAEKAAALAKKQKEDQAKMTEDANRGGRGGARGGERGGERGGADPYGMGGMVDPDHPKRRMVVGMVRPAGVQLQEYEDVRIGHWAIVVAKIPIKEQVKQYREAFENARGYDPMADLPQYLGYFVERAEIRPGDDSGKLEWKPVSVYDGKSTAPLGPAMTSNVIYGKQTTSAPEQTESTARFLTRDWVPGNGEVVDLRYLGVGPLVFPLPPLVGRDWGREATHSEIPLTIDNVQLEQEKKPAAEKTDEKADGETTDLFAAGDPTGAGGQMMGGRGGGYGGEMGGRGGGYGGMPGGYGGMARGGYGGEMGARGGGYGMGGYGGEMGGYGGEMGGRGGGMSGPSGGGFGADGNPLVKDWLLRFFDFSVEPGKKYKYRVRLVLLDPNQPSSSHYVNADYLDGSVIDRIKKEKKGAKATPYRLTEWSKPSRTVTIPLAGSVSVASAKPATEQYNSEPKANLLVQSFGKDAKGNAIQAAKEKEFQRGGVANMTEDTEVLVDQNRAIDPYKGFKFQTDITVADIRGGERLTRNESRPAQVLLMGPAGQLFVQDEVSDSETVETHKATFAKEAPGGGRGFMGGEGGGYGRGMMGPGGMGRGGR